MERAKIEELKATWSAPGALARSRPREVRITAQGIGIRVLCFLIMFGGPIALLLAAENQWVKDRKHPERQSKAWILLIPAVVLAAAGGLVYGSMARQKQLLEEGRLGPGVITKFTRTQEASIVHYEYVILNGSVMKGKCQGVSGLPGVGGTISVVYDAENPRRSRIYPFPFWALVNEQNAAPKYARLRFR